MENLYVIELEINSPEHPQAPEGQESLTSRLLAHVARWIDPSDLDTHEANWLRRDGDRSVFRNSRHTQPSLIQWTSIESPQASATRIQVIDSLAEGAGKFYSIITVARLAETITYRHALAKESLDGILQPTRVEDLERPRLVRNILQDPALVCRSQGMIVDGRYQLVRDDNELNWVVALLEQERRPPVLVVDSVRRERIDFAKETAQRLAGLAHVYAIPSVSLLRRFNETYPEWTVPFSGARLLWPGRTHRNPTYLEHETDHRSVSGMLRLLAGVSVAARGFDSRWARANRYVQTHQSGLRAAEADRRIMEAQADADLETQVAVLKDELELERRDHHRTRQELDQFIEEFDAPDRAQQERELGSLRYQLRVAQEALDQLRRRSGIVDLDDAPALTSHDLEELADFLQRASDGAITFTSAARRAWIKSEYPHPARMQAALIALTKAAIEWRDVNGIIGQSRTEWMKTKYGLNVAYNDDGLVAAGKDDFSFEGRTWSRVPHLKLDDHVAPNEVGRVYFAEDPDGQRFIVDHVGLKLYGL